MGLQRGNVGRDTSLSSWLYCHALQLKGAKRMISHIDTVCIGGILGTGAGILQIVFSCMLGHVGTLDIRPANCIQHFLHTGHSVAADLHVRRQHQLSGSRIDPVFHVPIDNTVFLFFFRAVVANHPLIAKLFFSAAEERNGFPDGQHRVRIHFHAVQGICVGAAPVEIHPAIFILEQIGIPERKRCRNLLKGSSHRIFCPQNGAVGIPPGCAEVEILTDLPYIRCIVIDQ